MTYTCPVCGYRCLTEVPWSEDEGGSYEICPSCGFQFGVSDDDRGFSYDAWRAQWVALGMPWHSLEVEPPPADWNPQQQLANLLDRDGGS